MTGTDKTVSGKYVRARKMGAWTMLAVLTGLLNATFGCRTQTADASDPDPHYYKGTNFHGKQRRA